jgi:hypothetical protein
VNTFCRFAQNDFVRLAVLAALLASTVAHAEPIPATAPVAEDPIEDAGPVFNAGSQYTAVFHQAQGQWRILPVTGQDLAIATGDCAAGRVHPKGVWLISRDDEGRVQLVAPSTTPLPAGAPDTIAVRSCDAPEADALVLPQPLIDLLAADAGAVLIDE